MILLGLISFSALYLMLVSFHKNRNWGILSSHWQMSRWPPIKQESSPQDIVISSSFVWSLEIQQHPSAAPPPPHPFVTFVKIGATAHSGPKFRYTHRFKDQSPTGKRWEPWWQINTVIFLWPAELRDIVYRQARFKVAIAILTLIRELSLVI